MTIVKKCKGFNDDSTILITFQNTTEQHKLIKSEISKYQELNKFKDNILRSVSHDLRTPLIAIQSNLELI